MMLERFIEEHTGKLVNFDGSPESAGQSPQLVAQWCQFLGLPYQWANAYDWWDDSDETFAEHWKKVNRPEASGVTPNSGDIVVFAPQLPGSDNSGHLSIFVRLVSDSNTSGWEGFDANWGGRSAHLQSHNWAYVVGWFTPVNGSVLEAEIPTPIAEPTISTPFESQLTEAQIMVIKNDSTPLYNLNDVAWDSFNTNLVSHVDIGYEFNVAAIAKHKLGGTFYMPDPSRAEGYAVEDCQEYGTSTADSSEPEYVLEPKDPQPLKEFHIGPPVLSPSTTDTIQIITPIPKYRMVREAFEGVNKVGDLNVNKYYVYKRMPNGIINVTLILGQSGYWINPEDLKPKVVPDWHILEQYDEPHYFKALADAPIVDMDGLAPDLKIVERQPILIAGFFRGPDGKTYAAPDVTYNGSTRQWYGLTKEILRPLGIVVESPPVHEPEVASSLPFRVRMSLTLQNSLLLKRLKEKYIRR
jgi:hypothetical protein